MANVMIHATVTLDGFIADADGSIDWMFDIPTVPEDQQSVDAVVAGIGAVVGGANRQRTIEDGEEPYGGQLGVPVFLMTNTEHPPITKGATSYTFVVDDIAHAVALARDAAADKSVALLGGTISRQCLRLGLVDDIHLDVVPILLGSGISLFGGLEERIDLELVSASGFAAETHLHYRVTR